MPGMSGLELKTSIKGKCKTIFITGHTNFALEAMGENAVSLLLKPFSLIQFNDAVLKAVKIIAFDKQKESVDGLKQKFNKLTDAEKKVILELPKAYGIAEIAKILNISTKTVGRHKENIKDKLGFSNNHELIIFAYELSKISN